MKRFMISALVATALAFPAMAALRPGAAAPDFKAKASHAGKTFDFSLASALRKGPVVLYFYPAAFTGGCNAEAHAFAEDSAKFAAAHATIIGVSGDSIQRLNAFSSDPKYCAGKFSVASDPEGAIGRSFNLKVTVRRADQPVSMDSRNVAIDNKIGIERTTFVITRDHRIAAVYSSSDDKIRPSDHADKSLALVETLANHRH